MSDQEPIVYRAAWEYEGQAAQISATANAHDRTITLNLPGGQSVTVDVPTSRAVQMLLNYVTYLVLEPYGPSSFDVQELGPRGGWHSVYETPPTRGQRSAQGKAERREPDALESPHHR